MHVERSRGSGSTARNGPARRGGSGSTARFSGVRGGIERINRSFLETRASFERLIRAFLGVGRVFGRLNRNFSLRGGAKGAVQPRNRGRVAPTTLTIHDGSPGRKHALATHRGRCFPRALPNSASREQDGDDQSLSRGGRASGAPSRRSSRARPGSARLRDCGHGGARGAPGPRGPPLAIATGYRRSTRARTARPSATPPLAAVPIPTTFTPAAQLQPCRHPLTLPNDPEPRALRPRRNPASAGDARHLVPRCRLQKGRGLGRSATPGSAPPSLGTARAKGCEERPHDAGRRRPRRRIGADPRPTLPLQWIPLLG